MDQVQKPINRELPYTIIRTLQTLLPNVILRKETETPLELLMKTSPVLFPVGGRRSRYDLDMPLCSIHDFTELSRSSLPSIHHERNS
jgi:hypothetical protein